MLQNKRQDGSGCTGATVDFLNIAVRWVLGGQVSKAKRKGRFCSCKNPEETRMAIQDLKCFHFHFFSFWRILVVRKLQFYTM
jgi:hypothetical protein